MSPPRFPRGCMLDNLSHGLGVGRIERHGNSSDRKEDCRCREGSDGAPHRAGKPTWSIFSAEVTKKTVRERAIYKNFGEQCRSDVDHVKRCDGKSNDKSDHDQRNRQLICIPNCPHDIAHRSR